MQITEQENTLEVTGIGDLSLECAAAVRDEIRNRFKDGLKTISIDLSTTEFIDSSGLGALVALQKTAAQRGGGLRILRPNPKTLQILELTRLHRVFEIVN
jgi:anti-sigma B factor antagonist